MKTNELLIFVQPMNDSRTFSSEAPECTPVQSLARTNIDFFLFHLLSSHYISLPSSTLHLQPALKPSSKHTINQ